MSVSKDAMDLPNGYELDRALTLKPGYIHFVLTDDRCRQKIVILRPAGQATIDSAPTENDNLRLKVQSR